MTDKQVRTANEISAEAEAELTESVREEAKRVWMKPVDQADFADIQGHIQQAAKTNHITLIAFADKVYTRLKCDAPAQSGHATWFKGAFGIRD